MMILIAHQQLSLVFVLKQEQLPGHTPEVCQIEWRMPRKKNRDGINLPKGVATINQFISSSLKSTFHSLAKCHPTLNCEDNPQSNYQCYNK